MRNVVFCLILSQLILLPLSRKWELDLKAVAMAGLLIGLAVGLVINVLSRVLVISPFSRLVVSVILIVAISMTILLIRFYRDPERVVPQEKNIIVAPADGIIKYIKSIESGAIPFSSKGDEHVRLGPPLTNILQNEKGYLIGIGMTFLDVHITRAPIAGRMTYFEHLKGHFYSLKKPEAPYRNERVIQIIQNDCLRIGLIHIASRLVRRIAPYVAKGDSLTLGQRIGMIKFGSQVDILVPNLEGLKVKIEVGEKVFAGATIMATYGPSSF